MNLQLRGYLTALKPDDLARSFIEAHNLSFGRHCDPARVSELADERLLCDPHFTPLSIADCANLRVGQEVQAGRNALQMGHPEIALGYLVAAAATDPSYRD